MAGSSYGPSSPAALLPGALSLSCHCGWLRVASSPSPTEAGEPSAFLRQCRKELPGKFRDFADQSPLTSQRRRQSIELRGALPVLTYSVATGQHPKPPYYAPDPFQYRTLTYVRLSE